MSERDRQMQDGTPCTLLQLVRAEPEWAASRIRVGERAAERERELVEALRFAEQRSRQPGEGNTAFFERLADEFYQRHGYLPPGKDDPLCHKPRDERQAAWEAFLNEPADARRKALAAYEKQ